MSLADKRLKQRQAKLKLRKEVFEAYGGFICAACYENDESILCLDHIHNNGNLHRNTLKPPGKTYNVSSHSTYTSIRKEFKATGIWPPGYQVLCPNCNHSKALHSGSLLDRVKYLKKANKPVNISCLSVSEQNSLKEDHHESLLVDVSGI